MIVMIKITELIIKIPHKLVVQNVNKIINIISESKTC